MNDSSGYVAAANALGLCGYTDWRLPARTELQSLVDYSVANPGPVIDSSWFPNTIGNWFTTSSPSIRDPALTWNMSFVDGLIFDYWRTHNYYVRLVRGQATTTAGFYTYSADGSEVTDTATGLTWRRCSEGQVWSGSTCTGAASNITHQNALTLAASQPSWRLPNIKELTSIMNLGRVNPSIDTAAFPNTISHYYWSSTPYTASTGTTDWIANFADGQADKYDRTLTSYVRLVR